MIENFAMSTKDFKIEVDNTILIFNYFNKEYYIGYYQLTDLNKQYTLKGEIVVINKNELSIKKIEDYFKISLEGRTVTGDYDIKYPRVAPVSFEWIVETINLFGEYQFNFSNSEYWMELNRENDTLRLTNLEKSYIYDFSSLQAFQTFYNYQFVINFIPTSDFPCYNASFQTGEKNHYNKESKSMMKQH